MLRRLFGTPDDSTPARAPLAQVPVIEVTRSPPPERDGGAHESWYVPSDGDAERFRGSPPPLRLIPYGWGSEKVLRLCEDTTGLLVGPTDRRLPAAGIWSAQVRGEFYYKPACRQGDFAPGVRVRLKREPDNEHDRNAVAITADFDGAPVAGYFNKQKASALAKVLDAGTVLDAVSVRGTGAGMACEAIGVVAASPEAIRHMLSPRPPSLPKPAHSR
jgi:HIRAN domain